MQNPRFHPSLLSETTKIFAKCVCERVCVHVNASVFVSLFEGTCRSKVPQK